MRGQIKFTLGIYLSILLLTIPCTATQNNLPRVTVKEIAAQKAASIRNEKITKLSQFISDKYTVDKSFVKEVVKHSYVVGENQHFPTAIDILAIIAIESNFNKYAVSKANAKGLMQILYKDTTFDIKANISDGVFLLKDYKERLPLEGTIQAYNVGIGNYRLGMRNKDYLNKFKSAKQQLENI